MNTQGALKLRFRDGEIEIVHGVTAVAALALLNRLQGNGPRGWLSLNPAVVVDTAELVMAAYTFPEAEGAA